MIPQEFETSVEIFTRVLVKYLVPRDEIEKFVGEARSGGYEMFRSLSSTSPSICDVREHLPNIEISSLRVTEKSILVAKTLREIELRGKYGVTLLAVQRGKKAISNPDADTRLNKDDVLIIMGTPDKLYGVSGLF